MYHLTDEIKTTRVLNAVAAGTDDAPSTAVDMAGFDGVRFVALFGALTAGQVTKLVIEHSDASSTGFDPVAGGTTALLADADGNKLLIADCQRPLKRYVRVTVDRGTQNAVIDGVIAEQYRARTLPTTQPTSVKEALKVTEPATAS